MSRSRSLTLFIVLVLAVASAPLHAQGVSLEGVGGGRLSEADLGHGSAVLVFWASWSPRGRNISDRVQAVARSANGRAQVAAVNYQEDAATVRQFLAATPLSVPVFLDTDGALAKKYKMANLPGLVVLKNGAVVYQGRLPDDAGQVVADALK
jgi:hypothetical protein